MRTCMLTSGH